MKIGFGKQDITPRPGVELYGYSGYLNRYASAVRDRLYARSMAVRQGQKTLVLVSCDLIFIPAWLSGEVRRRVARVSGLDPSSVMVHATHTHSGPCVKVAYRNSYDPPYTALLPRRIAGACLAAVRSLRPAVLSHAQVPCEGIGTNRVYDKFTYGEAAWEDDFRPDRPELTDTRCHVLRADDGDKLLGFISCFGCHNVVGGSGSTYLHGDYAGIATGMLERENPGSVGLFLQGADGDVNAAGGCRGDDTVLYALDVTAGRYARAVRAGLSRARSLSVQGLATVRLPVRFSRQPPDVARLRRMLADEEAHLDAAGASDEDPKVRWATLRSQALRDILDRLERGDSFENETELQGHRVGPVSFLATPLEVFQAIKNDVVDQAGSPVPLVMSVTNDEQGYAVDRTAAGNPEDYGAYTVPLWKHTLPYRRIHEELIEGLLEVDRRLWREERADA